MSSSSERSVESASASEINRAVDDFNELGVTTESHALAEPGLIDGALEDAPWFRTEIAKIKASGGMRTPYVITPGIEAVIRDPSIVRFVEGALGGDRWVAWGANIQTGVPNEAHLWHVDIESLIWPSITIIVGLEGCTEINATTVLARTFALAQGLSSVPDRSDERVVVERAIDMGAVDPVAITPTGFGNARFYAFDARGWHVGENNIEERTVLILHYHRAADERIPYNTHHMKKTWTRSASAFIAGPDLPGVSQPVNTRVARHPMHWIERTRRLTRLGRGRR